MTELAMFLLHVQCSMTELVMFLPKVQTTHICLQIMTELASVVIQRLKESSTELGGLATPVATKFSDCPNDALNRTRLRPLVLETSF